MDSRLGVRHAFAGLAKGVLVTGGLTCFAAFSYFFYHYQWLHDRLFVSTGGMLVYYAAPILLLAAFAAGLFQDSDRQIKLAFVVVSVSISVYLMEGFLQFRKYAARRWPAEINAENYTYRANIASRFGVKFDRRSRYDVIQDLRLEGIDAVPNIEPAAFWKRLPDGSLGWNVDETGQRPFPLGGISNRTTVFCNELGTWVIHKSDEHGFRNPAGTWNSPDIVALGDSLAVGACMPADTHFLGLIQRAYPQTLNLGISGMGPLSELGALKEYVETLRPKTVLWIYSEATDITDLAAEKKNPILMQYLQRDFSQHLLSRQREIDEEWTQLIEKAESEIIASRRRTQQTPYSVFFKRKAIGFLLLPNLRQRLGLIYGKSEKQEEGASETDPRLLAMFERVLSEAKSRTESWGGSIEFVYLPEWTRYAHPEAAAKNRDAVLGIVRKLNIHLIDLHPVFVHHPDTLALFPFRGYGHFSDAGSQLVATTILSALQMVTGIHTSALMRAQ